MKRVLLLPVVVLLVLCAARTASAAPAWGGNCLSCHDEWYTDTLYVVGEDVMADPDESGTGAPDRGTLKVFQVFPGDVKALLADVVGLDTDDSYAVTLKRLRFSGVENGGQLTYTGDCDWAQWEDPGDHYSDPAIGYAWGSGPTTFAFDIAVEPDASYDYYDLVFAVAGKAKDTGGLFYAVEHFYLQVLVLPGDLDEDGDVDLSDFAAFSNCLAGPENATPPGGCTPQAFDACDLDNDSDVDLDDFAAFSVNFTG